MVISSAYSRSLPTGTPIAMRVTRTPSGFSSFAQIDRRRLALDVGVGREHDLLDVRRARRARAAP